MADQTGVKGWYGLHDMDVAPPFAVDNTLGA
jgi:hypothetical protein